MSPRGGVRPGAGRPKGSRGQRARMLEERVRDAVGEFCPVAFLCVVAADEQKPLELRIDCAKGAAPYLAPRLKSIEVDAGVALDMTALLRQLARQRDRIEEDGYAAVPVIDATTGARMQAVNTGVPRLPGERRLPVASAPPASVTRPSPAPVAAAPEPDPRATIRRRAGAWPAPSPAPSTAPTPSYRHDYDPLEQE